MYGSGVCEACSWLTNLEEGISSSGSKEVNERVEGVPVLVELCTALNTFEHGCTEIRVLFFLLKFNFSRVQA